MKDVAQSIFARDRNGRLVPLAHDIRALTLEHDEDDKDAAAVEMSEDTWLELVLAFFTAEERQTVRGPARVRRIRVRRRFASGGLGPLRSQQLQAF